MKILDFKAYEKNTLRGFFTLELFPWLQIRECSVHEKNGRRWFSFPGIPYMKDGKTEYKNVIYVPGRTELDKLQAVVCRLLESHLAAEISLGDNADGRSPGF